MKRMYKKEVMYVLLGMLFISLTSATSVGTSELTEGAVIYTSPTNYSEVNVNNSEYFQGYTPTTFKDWLITQFNSVYCALTGCVMAGNINMSGNDIEDVGTITADEFIGDGSGLTNLSGETDNDFHIFFNGSAYNNIIYNLTDGDVDDIETPVEFGRKFIFGEIFT